MTSAMRCDAVRERLDDHADGLLTPRERLDVAEHVEVCEECRRCLADLEGLKRQAAALPRSIEPPIDLWPAIARELGAKQTEPRRTALRLRGLTPWWGGLAAAAALVAAVALGYLLGRPVAPRSTEGVQVVNAAWSAADEQMDRVAGGEELKVARIALRRALEARREELSPQTWAVVERNLGIIETAAGEIAVALEKDPGNRELKGLLVVAYQQHVELLRQAVSLPAGG